ncbi:hypothetical protein [uncultured Chitinophaga sp.]|jgi:hypothetical protein|uniref:hypothetical protein n=1 Tax=uncultured Chitinophaga sp. TaxID=339340 RepID=UPI0026072262|nr:hypothetical protein [uncultured Chitinophaga sp.]
MRKVMLLLLLCIVILAFSTWRDRAIQSPTPVSEELRPEMVPFYLVTFSITGFNAVPKKCNGTNTLNKI